MNTLRENNEARKRLHELAFMHESLGQALEYEVDVKNEDLMVIRHFAAMRRFELVALSLFHHLGAMLNIEDSQDEETHFFISVIEACEKKGIFSEEEFTLLLIMTDMIVEINYYDPEEYTEMEDFFESMVEQHSFIGDVLSRDFAVSDQNVLCSHDCKVDELQS